MQNVISGFLVMTRYLNIRLQLLKGWIKLSAGYLAQYISSTLICCVVIYHLDGVIHLLNNQALVIFAMANWGQSKIKSIFYKHFGIYWIALFALKPQLIFAIASKIHWVSFLLQLQLSSFYHLIFQWQSLHKNFKYCLPNV